jgi:N-acetylated-alpha-linked acidic dipeptidase
VIYSDPRDDGSVTVENGYAPYPHGPARNPTSVQRGSTQYVSSYPGDPTTPGYPAYENSTRTEGKIIHFFLVVSCILIRRPTQPQTFPTFLVSL